jgi:spore coat protein CotH
MPRYSATVEFYSIHNDVNFVKEQFTCNFDTMALYDHKTISVVKISISPEEAIKRIQELINGTAAYGSVSADNIQTILNNVI